MALHLPTLLFLFGNALACVGTPLWAQELTLAHALAEGDPYGGERLGAFDRTGSMALAPDLHSRGVEAALGGRPMLWAATPHVCIGSNLSGVLLPSDADERRWTRGMLATRQRGLPTIDATAHALDPWLRLHLVAEHLDAIHSEFTRWVGPRPAGISADPGHPRMPAAEVLGRPHRLVVLLLEGPEDMARLGQWLGGGGIAEPALYEREGVLVLVTSPWRSGDRSLSPVAFHAHLAHRCGEMLLRGCWRLSPDAPEWLCWGLGAHFARQVDPRYAEVPPEEQRFRMATDGDWREKVKGRVRYELAPEAAAMFGWTNPGSLGVADVACAWSRFEYVMTTEPEGLRRFLWSWKREGLPEVRSPARMAFWNRRMFRRAWGFEPDAFDRHWREWVLAAY